MASTLPLGEPVPDSGPLTAEALAVVGEKPFGLYLHVPFCATRCGYCDFNTYTADELGPGASRADYVDTAIAELRLARRDPRPGCCRRSARCSSAAAPRRCCRPPSWPTSLAAIDEEFGLEPRRRGHHRGEPGVGRRGRARRSCESGGFTRISFGMQSAPTHVLQALDRRHTPGRVLQRRGRGPRGRVRARQPRPHLRRAGGDRRRLARLARCGDRGRSRPRQRVRADRRGRHPARRAGAAGRAAGGRRRRHGRPLRHGRRGAERGRACTGTRCRTGRRQAAGAGTTSRTGTATTGGGSGRARTPTSAGCAGGT